MCRGIFRACLSSADQKAAANDAFKARKAQGGNYKRRLGATLNFLFKLSSGVNQQGDTSVLPTDDEYHETAVKGIGEAFDRGLNR